MLSFGELGVALRRVGRCECPVVLLEGVEHRDQNDAEEHSDNGDDRVEGRRGDAADQVDQEAQVVKPEQYTDEQLHGADVLEALPALTCCVVFFL